MVFIKGYELAKETGCQSIYTCLTPAASQRFSLLTRPGLTEKLRPAGGFQLDRKRLPHHLHWSGRTASAAQEKIDAEDTAENSGDANISMQLWETSL